MGSAFHAVSALFQGVLDRFGTVLVRTRTFSGVFRRFRPLFFCWKNVQKKNSAHSRKQVIWLYMCVPFVVAWLVTALGSLLTLVLHGHYSLLFGSWPVLLPNLVLSLVIMVIGQMVFTPPKRKEPTFTPVTRPLPGTIAASTEEGVNTASIFTQLTLTKLPSTYCFQKRIFRLFC